MSIRIDGINGDLIQTSRANQVQGEQINKLRSDDENLLGEINGLRQNEDKLKVQMKNGDQRINNQIQITN